MFPPRNFSSVTEFLPPPPLTLALILSPPWVFITRSRLNPFSTGGAYVVPTKYGFNWRSPETREVITSAWMDIFFFKVTTWKENYAPAVTTALVGQVFVNKDEGKNYSLKPIAAIKKKVNSIKKKSPRFSPPPVLATYRQR